MIGKDEKMGLLSAALIFGIVVLLFLLFSIYRNKGRSNRSTLVKILKVLVLAEAVVFIALYVVVIIRTMAM